MYTVRKRLEISAAHRLNLSYTSKCSRLHGHNWIIEITCQSQTLNQDGMVMDFSEISAKVKERLDHHFLNEAIGLNPTAENIAAWIADLIGPTCTKVTVQESEGNVAEYEP